VTATAAPSTPPIFRDDFNGVLSPSWVWVNEDPSAWTLSAFPGYLQVSVANGTVRDGDAKNLLLFPIPEGDIQVTTMFTFSPNENFQFAGLIFYQSEANHFQIGRSFCRGYGSPCIEAGIYVQFFKNYRIDTPNEATAYDTYAPILLRVTRRGNEYELDISGDGEIWIRYAKYTLDFEPAYVGLIAAENQADPAMALFDFFEISAPPK
jgi:beta-xylosidase